MHIVCRQYFVSTLLFLLQVKFEDVQCMYPGLYKAQVTVGDQTFGPKKSSTKKMARKFVAIVALKTLMNWEPAEGMLFSLMLQPIECFYSRGQHLCKFIGTRESVCIRKEFNSHRIGLGHQHGRRFIVWDSNMAAVTSCENTLWTCCYYFLLSLHSEPCVKDVSAGSVFYVL